MYFVHIVDNTVVTLAEANELPVAKKSDVFKEVGNYDPDIIGSTYDPTTGTFAPPTPPAPSLDQVMQAKLDELQAAHDAELYTSFTSKALDGVTPKTYNYDEKAAANFAKQVALMGFNPAVDSVEWYVVEDAAFILHTKAQFTQVVTDADAHERPIDMKFETLSANVKAAYAAGNAAAIQAITW